MATINWQTYDAFQILSRRDNPVLTQYREHKFDVHLYGVYLEEGSVFVGKVYEDGTKTEEERKFRITQMCARVDEEGTWRVVTDRQLESTFLPQAVPLNLRLQWVPSEVKLVIDAILLARPKSSKKIRT